MIDWFQTFKQFKPFKPPPFSSPASRGRMGEGEIEPSVAVERLERLELKLLGEYHG
jgi:hypothetical protein